MSIKRFIIATYEFNHFIVCHYKLSFHVTMTLFLFKTHHNVLQMCHTTFNHVRPRGLKKASCSDRTIHSSVMSLIQSIRYPHMRFKGFSHTSKYVDLNDWNYWHSDLNYWPCTHQGKDCYNNCYRQKLWTTLESCSCIYIYILFI